MQKTLNPTFPAQHQQKQPGSEAQMTPEPQYDNPNYKPAGKLLGKCALITGGDSGIGRSIAIHYAREGADVAILYLNENMDAQQTASDVKQIGRNCTTIAVDLKDEQAAAGAVNEAVRALGKLDILINNAAVQYPQNSIMDITREQLLHTFESNIFSMFYVTKAALPHMKPGGSIVNTTSITAFEGNPRLIDYSATKGAVVTFTRSMAQSLMDMQIRVNAVAPGPVWTPLIVSSFSEGEVSTFGSDSPMHRAAQPCELAPIYVYLASDDSSNVTGQMFHINGGTIIN